MERVFIFGGTGFIGLSLADHLRKREIEPILIGRHKPQKAIKHQFMQWDALTVGEWAESMNDALAVVNLAGKSVDCIKTPENCEVILNSRVNSTNAIGEAFKAIKNPPKIWVQMSTAHIYGDPPTEVCTEASSYGEGLAPMVGQAWEKAFDQSKPSDLRGVILRTSFVIGKNGGALRSLKRIVKLGLGGTVGTGKQGMSWIHEYDMNEIIYSAITNEKFNGVYIATAPHPVSNKVFMKSLRRYMKIPIGLPAPAFIVRLGAKLVFRTDPELALLGRFVKSDRIATTGFTFKYPILDEALDHLIS